MSVVCHGRRSRWFKTGTGVVEGRRLSPLQFCLGQQRLEPEAQGPTQLLAPAPSRPRRLAGRLVASPVLRQPALPLPSPHAPPQHHSSLLHRTRYGSCSLPHRPFGHSTNASHFTRNRPPPSQPRGALGLHGPTPSRCYNNKHRKHSHRYFNSCKLTTHGPTRWKQPNAQPPPSKTTVGNRLIGNTSPTGSPLPVFTTTLKTALRWGEDGNTKQLQPHTQHSELKSAIGLTPGAKRCSNHKQGHTPAEHSPQSHTTMTAATRATSSACSSCGASDCHCPYLPASAGAVAL